MIAFIADVSHAAYVAPVLVLVWEQQLDYPSITTHEPRIVLTGGPRTAPALCPLHVSASHDWSIPRPSLVKGLAQLALRVLRQTQYLHRNLLEREHTLGVRFSLVGLESAAVAG